MKWIWIGFRLKKTWRLNEKHYGMLQGLNKAETAEKYGDEQVLIWRRSYDVPPTPLDKGDERSPFQDPVTKMLTKRSSTYRSFDTHCGKNLPTGTTQ